MRGGLLLICLVWTVGSLWSYFTATEKTPNASRTAMYIIGYPIAIYIALAEKPIPQTLGVLLVMAGVPWLFAGVHLSKILNDPSQSKPGEFIGFSKKFWAIGIGASIAVGIIFEK